jgi:hypothetical protein
MGMNWSGHGKEASERGALTRWRAHQDGLVRTWKGREQARSTHELESASGWTGQDIERKRASERHSHPGERIGMNWSGHGKEASEGHSRAGECMGMNWSGHGKEASERGALTSWRGHRDGRVRTWKGSERASEGHSLAGEGIGMDWSGHEKEASERARGTHILERASGWIGQDMERKGVSERGALTRWRGHRDGLVRT